MSELAYRYQEHSNVYTTTEGNVTRIFFGRQPETPAPVEVERPAADTIPTCASFAVDPVKAATEMSGLTPRQQELAKPDAKDMSVVPLESYEQMSSLINYFESRRNYREACLLTFGFCTGLRISDLLALKISDIVESVSPIVFKRVIDIHEQKTGKRTVSHIDETLITPAMQEAFTKYYARKNFRNNGLGMHLFTPNCGSIDRPVTIRMIQKSLEPAFAAVCPHLHCSTHTMRKTFVSIIHTFASQATMTGAGLNPATACQIALRHANASTTLAYMGTMKSGMLSLRKAVSDFVQGKTKIKSLKSEYSWELDED